MVNNNFFNLDTSSDESEVPDIDLLVELSEGLDDLALAEKFCRSPLPDLGNRRIAKPKKKSKSKATSAFHLDDWISFQMETSAAYQLFALRQKWQVCYDQVTTTWT